MARVAASLKVLASQMAREHADVNEGFRMGIAPPGLLGATLRGPFIGIGTALLLVAALTLLVACANLSGLMLAHASARQKEIAIRYAIGAGRAAILRMMLAESLLIALGGSVLGFLTGVWLARIIEASKPAFDFPIDTHFGMDGRVAIFAVALSLASAAVFGLLPGLRASRVDLTPALKSGTGAGASRHWTLRDVFVGVQIAVCMVLVAGALMMVKTLKSTLAKNFGFNPAGAVTLRFDLGMQGYSKERGVEFQRRLLDRVRAMPGVQAAGLADRLPLSIDSSSNRVSVEGASVVPEARLPMSATYDATPDFFRSLGTRIVVGRDFNAQDKEGSPKVAIVSQIFAEKLLAGRDPLSTRFRFGDGGDWYQIVGVVERGKNETITEDPAPAVWLPLAQDYSSGLALVVRSSHADAALLTALRHAVEELDPDVSIFDAKTLRQHLDVPLTPLRWTTAVLTAMGVVVLFLAALGLYGILSYTTGRQTREIGIRLALGAQPRHVLLPVLTRTIAVVSMAAVLGMIVSIPVTRLLANLLSGDADVTAQLFAVATLAAACLVASVAPIRRALRVDPATALRQE
jgi:predicted permease